MNRLLLQEYWICSKLAQCGEEGRDIVLGLTRGQRKREQISLLAIIYVVSRLVWQ